MLRAQYRKLHVYAEVEPELKRFSIWERLYSKFALVNLATINIHIPPVINFVLLICHNESDHIFLRVYFIVVALKLLLQKVNSY